MPLHKVCTEDEISDQQPKKFFADEKPILLAKDTSGKIYAFDVMCTHADRSMERGTWDAVSASITCPFHKAIFCIAEHGAVKTPPACIPLPVYEVTLKDEHGTCVVYVDVGE